MLYLLALVLVGGVMGNPAGGISDIETAGKCYYHRIEVPVGFEVEAECGMCICDAGNVRSRGGALPGAGLYV